MSTGQTGSGQAGEEKGETEAGGAGCAGILWIHESWNSELLLLQRQVLASCLGVHGLSKACTDGRLGMCWRGILRKSAHPPPFSSLCASKNGLSKNYPAKNTRSHGRGKAQKKAKQGFGVGVPICQHWVVTGA